MELVETGYYREGLLEGFGYQREGDLYSLGEYQEGMRHGLFFETTS